MFGLILSAVIAATVLTPDTILDRVPGTATLKEMVDAVDNDVDARKQDNLPYPTNAIPASVIVYAPWLLTTESATNYADAVAEKQNVYLRSKADLTVYLGHFGEWTLTRWNETKDMPPEEFRDMRLYSLSNVVEVMMDEYGAVTNTGSFEVYYNGGLICTGTNGPIANATMFHPVITFTLPPPENTRTVSTFVAARLSDVSPTDDRLAKLSDIEGGVSGLVETQAQHTVTLADHAVRIAVMETGKRDLTNNVCVSDGYSKDWHSVDSSPDVELIGQPFETEEVGVEVWLWYGKNCNYYALRTNDISVTFFNEQQNVKFTAIRPLICVSNELYVTQSAVKDAAVETRAAASNYTDRVAAEKSDVFRAWTFAGLASRGFVDAKLSFKATPSLTTAPIAGVVPLKASSPAVGVWTLLAKTSVDGKWEDVGSYMGSEDVTVIDSFDGAETISASRETVLYTKAISADNPAFSNAVEKIVENEGPTKFETWTNGVALAVGRNAQADSQNDWTRTIALGSESSARADGVTVGGDSVAVEKGVSVGLRAGKGYSNRTPGSEAVSLGFESSATNKAVALGTGALATNEAAVVIGADAVSHGEGSVTLGKAGTTLNDVFVGDTRLGRTLEDDYLPRDYTNGQSIALGNNTIVSTNGSTAIGQGSYAKGEYATSVGGSDANGMADLTVGLNNQTFLSAYNHLFGHENTSYGYGNGAFGLQNFLYGNWIWAFGEVNTVSNAQFAAAIGINNINTSSDSFIYGKNNVLDDSLSSVVIGEGNTASNGILTVVGQDNVVDGRNGVSIAIGNHNELTGGIDTMSFGSNNKNYGQDTITIGHAAVASNSWSMALGNNATATNISSVSIGQYSHSHGTGTFNINPKNGLDGFWVGETNMTYHIRNIVPQPDMDRYYTKDETDAEITSKVSQKRDKGDFFTRWEIDGSFYIEMEDQPYFQNGWIWKSKGGILFNATSGDEKSTSLTFRSRYYDQFTGIRHVFAFADIPPDRAKSVGTEIIYIDENLNKVCIQSQLQTRHWGMFICVSVWTNDLNALSGRTPTITTNRVGTLTYYQHANGYYRWKALPSDLSFPDWYQYYKSPLRELVLELETNGDVGVVCIGNDGSSYWWCDTRRMDSQWSNEFNDEYPHVLNYSSRQVGDETLYAKIVWEFIRDERVENLNSPIADRQWTLQAIETYRPLTGKAYDFSTTQGFYIAVQDLVEKLGGKVINPYSP